MTRISLSETAHNRLRHHLATGDIALDATLGNGHDCLFLAGCVGQNGHVFGFDLQQQAVQNTVQRLQQHQVLERVTLFQASHADMAEHIPSNFHGQIQVIMFNLGYLPGADKSVITQSHSTLPAVTVGCELLAIDGVMTVMAYPGHAGGDDETRQLTAWCQGLDTRRFQTELIFSQQHQSTAPRLFLIRKIA